MIWQHLAAREAGTWSLHSEWPCAQLKIKGFLSRRKGRLVIVGQLAVSAMGLI